VRAAVFHEVGKPLVVETVPDPKPGPGELVLAVKACGICGTDVHGAKHPPGLPHGTVMGHEFAGEVVELGSGSDPGFAVGDRVCAVPFIGCGSCRGCLSGDPFACPTANPTGLGVVSGAYAEFVKVRSEFSLALPESLSYAEGALVEPLSVGLHAVKQSRLCAGERVLVIGAGPIGLVTATWAKLFGARDVIVSELAPGRLALAEHFGASGVIDASREEVGPAFERLAGGAPDLVFECVGVPGLLQQSVSLVRPRGRVCVVGMCTQPDTLMPASAMIKEIEMIFVLAYRSADFALSIDMLDRERIAGLPMITERVGLDDLPTAFQALFHPTTQCKIILEP